MENHIALPNNNKIYIDLREQVGSRGEPFRLSSIRQDLSKPSRWINKLEKHHYIYLFKYLDGSGMFEIEIDYYDKFVDKRIA